MGFFVTYVLASKTTGETYVGQTEDLARRIAEHNDPNNRRTLHTKRRLGPWILVHWESYRSRADAMERERFFKTGHGREWIKERLVAWLADPPSLP